MNILKKNEKNNINSQNDAESTKSKTEMDLNARILNKKLSQTNWLKMVDGGFRSNGDYFEDIEVKIIKIKDCFVKWNDYGKPDKKYEITKITENMDEYKECVDLIMVDEDGKIYAMTFDQYKLECWLKPYVKKLKDSNMQIYDVMTRLSVRMENTYKILVFECLGGIEY